MSDRDGLLAVAATQTSRAGSERPYPGFKFPKHKVPRALAVTTSNEFALVTIWDTDRNRGQLAVIALEGKYLPFHTWPYMAMPNQGSFSDFKLLGYIDLPMNSPDAVAAASAIFASAAMVDIDRPVNRNYYDIKEHFASAVPIVMFLRATFATLMWQPFELGALAGTET